jgi:hypothetical protein
MSDQRRLRREDPVRTDPIRDWATLYRRSDSWGTHDSATDQEPAKDRVQDDSPNDMVTRGVELGYRVVEEHIRQGQRVAQQINNRSYSLGKVGNDVQELAERIFRDSTDLLSLWFGMVNSLVGNPDLVRSFSRSWQPRPESQNNGTSTNGVSPNPGPTNRGAIVSIEIVSHSPVHVTLDLYPQSEGLSLVTDGLRARDPQKPPLTDISFEPSSDKARSSLRIRVPEGQPPDVYTGVVVERNTGLPRGTLSVRIAG